MENSREHEMDKLRQAAIESGSEFVPRDGQLALDPEIKSVRRSSKRAVNGRTMCSNGIKELV